MKKATCLMFVFALILSITGCTKSAVSTPPPASAPPAQTDPAVSQTPTPPDTTVSSTSEESQVPYTGPHELYYKVEQMTADVRVDGPIPREPGRAFNFTIQGQTGRIDVFCAGYGAGIETMIYLPDGRVNYTVRVNGSICSADVREPWLVETLEEWPQADQDLALLIVETIINSNGDLSEIDAVIRSSNNPTEIKWEITGEPIRFEYLNGCLSIDEFQKVLLGE